MCTVSFVKRNGIAILTSNRDEKVLRGGALAPKVAIVNGKKIIFPRDAKAGGTWFAASEDGNVAVLLNGAFQDHLKKENYRKSRGLIMLDIIGADAPHQEFETIDLENIEPFTVILNADQKLFQLVWDGDKKNRTELDTNMDYIWSSVTLYSSEIIYQRQQWFKQFLLNNPIPNKNDLRNFHANTSNEDQENGLIINRANIYKTLSITQAEVLDTQTNIYHSDLMLNQFHVSSIARGASLTTLHE